MRWLSLFPILLSACSVTRLLPKAPALSDRARLVFDEEIAPSGVAYTGNARAGIPVPPVHPWAAAYDVDLVLVTDHPQWDMHELAMVRTPEGPVWLAKDARRETLVQTLTAGLDDLHDFMPEIPVPRRSFPVQVEDRSTDDNLDLDVFWETPDGEPARLSYQGPRPRTEQKKRNGSTMGHSRDHVLAVLDLPLRDFARHSRLVIGGEEYKVRRIAGLVPFHMALTQTQAGIGAGDLALFPSAPAFDGAPVTSATGIWHHDAVQVDRTWQVAHTDRGVDLVQRSALRTLRHSFIGTESWEWIGTTVVGFDGREQLRVVADRALPDLRRPFGGTERRTVVFDVAGQRGHAVADIAIRWEDDQPRIEVRGRAPWWVADRSFDGSVSFSDGGARLQVERTAGHAVE